MAVIRGTALWLILFSVVFPAAVNAAPRSLNDLTGTWQGQLQLPRRALPLVLHLSKDDDGFEASLDSPAQGARGIPVTDVSLTGRRFSFSAPSIGGRYEGTVGAAGEVIEGKWSQGAVVAPLNFRRADVDEEEGGGASSPAAKRPQTPAPPFPYREEEVEFPSLEDGIVLAGTLTLPKGGGPFPAVVLITGSGPQDRDETIAGHKPFLVIADYLTRRGVAVLRFDDRGVGASKGDFRAATTRDFAKDAAGALRALRARSEIEGKAVGYIGHSEGGVAAMVAQNNLEPANFLVLLSTPILPYPDYVIDQVRALAQAAGDRPSAVEAKVKAQKRIIDAALMGRTPEETRAAVADALVSLGVEPKIAARQAAPFGSAWMFSLLRLDPRPALGNVRAPVLGLWGGKDLQVAAVKHRAAARKALTDNPDADLKVLAGLNHLLQPARTGRVEEYGETETTIAPRALIELASWLQRVSSH